MLIGYVYAFSNPASSLFAHPACSQNTWPWCQSASWGTTLEWFLLPGRAIILLNIVPWNYHRWGLLQLTHTCFLHCAKIVKYQTIRPLELVFTALIFQGYSCFHWMKGRWNKRILNCKTSPKAKNRILLILFHKAALIQQLQAECVSHDLSYSFPLNAFTNHMREATMISRQNSVPSHTGMKGRAA